MEYTPENDDNPNVPYSERRETRLTMNERSYEELTSSDKFPEPKTGLPPIIAHTQVLTIMV